MTLTARLNGPDLQIDGSSNLPDGAIIEWEVIGEQSVTRSADPSDIWAEEGQAVISRGKYSATVDLKKWPRNHLMIWVAFQPVAFGTLQPKVITEMFGECGELLLGDNVSVVGSFKNMRRVELIRSISWLGPQ